jgi:hypothetical protein
MNSQTNHDIQDFNTKLSKRAKLFRHVNLVEMNFNSKYFTNHGFHLNNVGKEGVAEVQPHKLTRSLTAARMTSL